jgi:hypothetical protein
VLALVLTLCGMAPADGAETGAASLAPVAAGTIRGRLVSCSGSVPGVRVSIEGHPSPEITGLAGIFTLSSVPPGTHDVTVEASDQPRATITGVRVVAGETTDLGEIPIGDLTADAQHCGACTTRCPPEASCEYGACLCAAGLVRCGDRCVTLTNVEHCRACGNSCPEWPNTIPRCGPDDCIFSCVEGFADCDGRRITGCETRIESDPTHCGACNIACAPDQVCVDYVCRWRER